VSCAAPGDCSAGGYYAAGSGSFQVFVAVEKRGTWGQAQEVPGSAALNKGGDAQITSVSCAAPGDCSAGGWYENLRGGQQALVVSERGGIWGRAEEVPGSGALNTGGDAQVESVSCGSAGNCSAGGFYMTASVQSQAFVVSERNGIWGKVEIVPGMAVLNKLGSAGTTAVSCAAADRCSAGGEYGGGSGTQAFVVSRT
jgi:hypothetical protein